MVTKLDNKSIEEIETQLNEYSLFLQKSVKDLKKRNTPLDKKYYKKTELRWFGYKKWYYPSIGKRVEPTIDWTKFVYALYHDLETEKFYIQFDTKIKQITGKEKHILYYWLITILFVLFNEEKDPFFSRKKLVKYFIQNLKNEKPIIQTISLFTGIVLTVPEIVLDRQLKIRKAKRKDLEFRMESGENSHNHEDAIKQSFCILEYTYKKEREHEHISEALRKIEMIFELFKLCSAKCTYTIEKSSEIDFPSYGPYTSGFYPVQLPYYAKIKNSEIIYLKKFYKIMNKRLTGEMVNCYVENNEIEIALSRYAKGLEWAHLVKISASYAVMAIEALLIKSEGDQKLRFALFSSKLLSLVGLDMKQVYEHMLLAYAVRSSYVHGDKIKKPTLTKITKKFNDTGKFAFTIMDYARLIISIYILLNKTKDSLYEMLENTPFENDDKTMKKTLKPFLKYLNTKNYKPKFRQYEIQSVEYLTE